MSKMTNDKFLSALTFSRFENKKSWNNELDLLVDAKQMKNFVMSTLEMMLDEDFDSAEFARIISSDSLARNVLMNVFFFALDIRNHRHQLTHGEEMLYNSEIKGDLTFWEKINKDCFVYSTPIWDAETFHSVVDCGVLEMEYENTNVSEMMAVAISYCLSREDTLTVMKILWECLPRERFTITDYIIGNLTYADKEAI